MHHTEKAPGAARSHFSNGVITILARRPAALPLLLSLTLLSNGRGADLATQIYERASPSVFVISVRSAKGDPIGFGTGFLIAKNTLVTNVHVVDAGEPFVEQGAFRIPAKVEKRDDRNDLAIITVGVEIAATPLPVSQGKTLAGETIFAIGTPEGLEKSISTGIVAAVREFDGRKLVQITAPISHGSSGGPILNASGEVIGIAVAMMKDGQNLNFAVPADALQELIAGKMPDRFDLQTVFQHIEELTATENLQQYSNDPDSEWQKTFSRIQSLFKTALDAAGNNPELLLKIAEEARNKDSDAALTAAERANSLKATQQSEFILGEVLSSNAFFARATESDNLRERAEKAFRAAIRLSESPKAEVYFGLANVLEDRGSMQEAETDFERSLKLGKTAGDNVLTANSVRGLIRTSFALKRFADSESWFRGLTDTGSATAWDWEIEGARLSDQKKDKDAGNAHVRAATMGGSWTNWCTAAIMYWIIAEDDALTSARSCLDAGTGKPNSDKSMAAAHNILSDILNRRGVYIEALGHAKEAIDLDSSNAWHFQDEADALFGLRRFQEAINASTQAIRLSDGKYSGMHFRLGASYFELENWQFAEQSFEKAAALEPTDTASPYNVALCLQHLGYRPDAVKWFREVLRRNPQSPDRTDIQRRITLLTGEVQ
jgi:serine protease Do